MVGRALVMHGHDSPLILRSSRTAPQPCWALITKLPLTKDMEERVIREGSDICCPVHETITPSVFNEIPLC